MSITKYLKDTPDYTIPNTTGYSTDGQNLRCYKLGNAGDTVGYDWCFATNYNDEVRYENTILGTSDSLEANKNGYITENVDGNLYFTLNKDNLAENYNKLSGGLCGGILYVPNDIAEADIHNCYVIENLDFNKVILKVTAYGTVNNPVAAEKINIDNESESVLNAGYLIEVNILNNNFLNNVETIGIRYVEYFISDGLEYIKPYYINARELQPNSRNNTQSAALAYNNSPLSKPYYGEQDGLTFNTPYWDGKHHIVTTMYPAEKYKLWEEHTRTTQYYIYYASYVTNQATVKDLIHLLNSSGLRYYDSDHTDITDIKNNVFIGVMDEDGVTDCYNRIKGWDEIEASDLPNKDRNGYDWDVYDPTKPPTPGDDYPDDPWGKIEWGGAYLGAGNFTNLWYCTATDLENLRRWMNGADAAHPLPEGFNPMNQILGLMQFPIGLGGTLTEELTMRTQANVTVHSGVMINRGFGDDLYYNLGSIDIPLRMKERGVPFLDYGSTIELYVPFCGVFQLDPQTVLGADLSVEMWLSPVTGECNCIVSVGRGNNRGPVAFGSGNMAADIPVTANGYGLYAAAAKEASLKRSELMFGGLTQGVQSLSAGANTANTLAIGEQIAGESIAGAWGAAGAMVGGASAAIGLGVALAQATHNIRALDVGMQHVKNASGTSVSGSFSGTSAWHYPFQCYVKITRPRYRIPSNYAHTQGIPLIKAKPLSECNGFTMCVGTDLSSVSATEIEKEQIAAFLSNGVIV